MARPLLIAAALHTSVATTAMLLREGAILEVEVDFNQRHQSHISVLSRLRVSPSRMNRDVVGFNAKSAILGGQAWS